MGLGGVYTLFSAMNMMEDIRGKNKEKIEEARKLYWDACKYPRKKKKALRKKAIKDFVFFSSLEETLDNMFI